MRSSRASWYRRVLRYLAVAHYGRGRGDWVETEYPPFWTPLVAGIVDARHAAIGAAWARREGGGDERAIENDVRAILAGAARETFARLYPGAPV